MTTLEQIRALALQGVSRRNAEATIGHPFDADELEEWRKADTVRQLRRAAERAGRPAGATAAERLAKFRKKRDEIELLPLSEEAQKRRARLERAPERWLRYYFPNVFTLPFSDGHRAIIEAVVESDAKGDDVVIAAPRGEGKTNILRLLSVYLVFAGRTSFVVVGGWQFRSAAEAFNTWTIAITSERLVADYPEFCAPFADSTHANRLPRLHWKGETRTTGAAINSTRMLIVFPDGRGALAAGSLQGDIKGLNITTTDGASLRPTKVLLDDPQDTSRAADPAFVSETLYRIDTQWRCLSGPETRLSMMVACTIFAPGDVGDSLGHRKGTIFIRIPRVLTWPRNFDAPDSEVRGLWDQWYDLYCDEKARAESFAFYRRNRRKMCDGFKVSWRHRFDKSKGDPDALFSAMVDYYTKGREAFFSEYQNQPIDRTSTPYEITPQCVQSHVVPLAPNTPPEGTIYTVLTTDINYSYGLTWEVAAFTRSRTCHVLAHGVWCQAPLPISTHDTNQVRRQEAVRAALELMAQWVALQPWHLDRWLIDAGGEQFETVTSFCRTSRKAGGIARAIIGRAGKTYNPTTRTQFGRVIGRTYQCYTRESGRWYCFDADHYKEAAQTSWITPPGQSGAATIYYGGHRDYAEQMCREVLAAKGVLETRTGASVGYAYKWDTLPGKHDFLDCHAMAYAAAGRQGILSTGATGVHLAAKGDGSAAPAKNKRKVYNG